MSFNNPFVSSYKGAFSLDEVHTREVNRDYPDTGGIPGTYGWVAGGFFGSAKTAIDRIDFANDTNTAVARIIMQLGGRYQHAAAGNNNFGWVAGGISGPGTRVSSIERVDYSSDLSILTSSNLSSARQDLSGIATSKFGWFGGGYVPASPFYFSNIERLDFSNDSVNTSFRVNLPANFYRGSAVSNESYGWWAGSEGIPYLSSVYRLDFSNDIVAPTTRGVLSITNSNAGAAGNTNYGWIAGGRSAFPTANTLSRVDRIDYSNDLATALTRSTLSQAVYQLAGSGNANFGWFSGGYYTPAPFGSGGSSKVDRVDYASDTTIASTRGPLAVSRYVLSSTSNYVKAYPFYYPPNSDRVSGYGWNLGGGRSPSPSVAILKTDFSNDTSGGLVRGNITAAFDDATNNANYSWTIGGSPYTSEVDRFDFSNDLNNPIIRGSLSAGRYGGAGLGNSNYGWYGGGKTAASLPAAQAVTTVERIDYANDITAASTRGPLAYARTNLGKAMMNRTHGWFAGGVYVMTPGPGISNTSSILDRIAFSNDTVTALTNVSIGWQITTSASSNKNFGWIYGGFPAFSGVGGSNIGRMDFSNESAGVVIRATFPGFWAYTQATGNDIYGWIFGGSDAAIPTPVYRSSSYRIDYSNDTASPIIRAPSGYSIFSGTAVSNYVRDQQQQPLYGNQNGTYGWINQGSSTYSIVERIDFSNDTAATRTLGITSLQKLNAAATSNNSFGWFSAGRSSLPAPAPVTTSYIERLDLYNDVLIVMPRSTTSIGKLQAAGTGNSNYGWIAGGADVIARTVIYSTVERMTYASDTITPVTRGTLSIPRANSAATSNSNYGWIAAGDQSITFSPTQTVASVDRIDFANDLATASARGTLNSAVTGLGATGNNNFGWFVGGYRSIPSPTSQAITIVSRIDYSNDSVTASSRGQMTFASYGWAATSNSNYGWFIRDVNSYRIDFANDTVLAATRGPLAASRYAGSAVSNYVKDYTTNSITQYNKGTTTVGTGAGTYGWFGSGYSSVPAALTPVTTLDRIDFSNDSATALSRASNIATSPGNGAQAWSNTNYGWWFKGTTPVISRVDFSNDNISANRTPNSNLAGTRYSATVSSTMFGWSAGGVNPGATPISNIYRIDFANDYNIAPARGPLSTARFQHSGMSNSVYGWFVGGLPGPFSSLSLVDRLNFSNDLAITSTRIPGADGSSKAATSNANYGWCGWGFTSTPVSATASVSRLDFSNDTTLSRGAGTAVRGYVAAAGNANYGWFAGGVPSTSFGTANTYVERIDYANDSASASVRGPLTAAKYWMGGASNYTK